MSVLVELEQSALLHRAADRGSGQCADGQRRAFSPRGSTFEQADTNGSAAVQ